MKEPTGIIFNVQKFSIHDGPGIRTLVFFKGCPLRCLWCCNPESQNPLPEHGYRPEKCFGCGRCVSHCGRNILSFDERHRLKIARGECYGECPDCTKFCPDKALTIYGTRYGVEEVMNIVERDALFYSRSGGGLTLSGGEPLMQPEFAIALLAESKKRRINTAMETCGHVPEAMFLTALGYVDFLMMDLKHIDSGKHRELTGMGNERILANIRAARHAFPSLRFRIRTPVIPGINDSEENLAQIHNVAKNMRAEYELLAYHSLGRSKYASLDRRYAMEERTLDEILFSKLQKQYNIL